MALGLELGRQQYQVTCKPMYFSKAVMYRALSRLPASVDELFVESCSANSGGDYAIAGFRFLLCAFLPSNLSLIGISLHRYTPGFTQHLPAKKERIRNISLAFVPARLSGHHLSPPLVISFANLCSLCQLELYRTQTATAGTNENPTKAAQNA